MPSPQEPSPHEPPPRESFRAGIRAGIPFAIAGGLLSLSFGVLAREVGFSAIADMMIAPIAAAALMNSRFLPMGIALAPSLRGGWLTRAAQGQTVVDASWAMANRGGGRFDRHFLFGATVPQYVTWFSGTVIGALLGSSLPDPETLGLDAIYPAFFLALLLTELRDRRSCGVALAGAALALALVPFTPSGIPVLAASVAALAGLWRQRTAP